MSSWADEIKNQHMAGPQPMKRPDHMAGPGKMGDKIDLGKATPMPGRVRDIRKERADAQRTAVAEGLAKFVANTQTFKNAVAQSAINSQAQAKPSQATTDSVSTTPPAIPPASPSPAPFIPYYPLPAIPNKTKPYALVWNPDATGGAKMEWKEIKDCAA